MTTTQCGICLDYHLTGAAHCHTCGALLIGKIYYNAMTGRVMARAIPTPVYHLISGVVEHCKALPIESVQPQTTTVHNLVQA